VIVQVLLEFFEKYIEIFKIIVNTCYLKKLKQKTP